jgi:nucleotide-binding universal stress UspA family protein
MLRILIALDGSENSEQALLHGAAIGRCFESELLLLRVISMDHTGIRATVDAVDWQLQRQQAASYLARQTEKLKSAGLNASWTLEEGNAADRIICCARQNNIDLIVLGALGHTGPGQFTRGGIAQKVISAAPTSILVGPPPVTSVQKVDSPDYKSILVPVDGTSGCQWILNMAAAIAAVHGAELILMQAIQKPQLWTTFADVREKRELLDQLMRISRMEATSSMQELKATLPPNLKVATEIVVTDNVANSINDMANTREVSLVALGAHSGASDSGCHFGMVPEFLLAHANRPVLVFQHDNSVAVSNFRSIYLQEQQANAS